MNLDFGHVYFEDAWVTPIKCINVGSEIHVHENTQAAFHKCLE